MILIWKDGKLLDLTFGGRNMAGRASCVAHTSLVVFGREFLYPPARRHASPSPHRAWFRNAHRIHHQMPGM